MGGNFGRNHAMTANGRVHSGAPSRSASLLPPRRAPFPFRALALAALLALACAVTLGAAAATPAWAKDYTMPQVNIEASLDDQGTLQVTETRTFSFSGDFTCVWWEFDSFGANAELAVEGASLEQGGASRDLAAVPFVTRWRTEGGPGGYAYSVDEAYDGVYVFFNASDEQVSVTLRYRVEGMVTAYDDVAELYWQYIGSEWAADSRNTTLTLHLPLPAGETAVAGDTVRAWGHGPLSGEVSIGEDGTVTCTVPRVDAGSFAEVRTTFPVSWLSPDADAERWSYSALPGIVDEETELADEANAKRARANALYFGYFGLCAVFLAASVALFLRFGREHTPHFKDEYWRDVPDRSVHPLVVKYVESWGQVTTKDFTAELMHLTASGAVYLGTGSFEKPVVDIPEAFRSIGAALFGQQAMQQRVAQGGVMRVEDYYLARLPKAAEMTDPIDRAALDLLFNKVAGGADSLWFEAIELYGERHRQQAVDEFDEWKDTVKKQAKAGGYLEKPNRALKVVLTAAAWVIGLGGAVLATLNEVFWVGTVLAVVVSLTLVRFMPRRTRAGAELHAKAQALEHWLDDFTLLNERLPQDVKVWGEFMVYATLFGVAKKVMDKLRIAVPEVYRESTTASGSGWGLWLADTRGVGATASSLSGASAFDAFSSTFGSSFTTSSSSGGGGGGGFSGGGGGGGGGGGAR